MPEEKIIGPLSLKQFIRLAIGIALAYTALKFLHGTQAQIVSGAIIVITILGTFITTHSESFDINRIDEYVDKMVLEKGKNKTILFLQKKIAEVISQNERRKLRGFSPDPQILKAQEALEKSLTRISTNS